jgi:hypothetical protein
MPTQRHETRRAGAGAAAAIRPARPPAAAGRVRQGRAAPVEVLGVACHGTDHGYVSRRDDVRRRVATRRDQPPSRFVSIDAAVMRRVTQRAGDIAAGTEGRQPGGEGRPIRSRSARSSPPVKRYSPNSASRQIDQLQGPWEWAEVTVVGAPLLRTISRALARIHVDLRDDVVPRLRIQVRT